MKRPRPSTKRPAPEPITSSPPSEVNPRPAAPPPSSRDDLARLVRRSRVLDPVAKRQWLAVLPFLTPADRARLNEVLSAD